MVPYLLEGYMITLIDTHNILHRLHHVPSLKALNVNFNRYDENGEPLEEIPSGTFYGFLNILSSLFHRRLQNEYFFFVFDDKPTRKKQLFPDYKANRVSQNSSFYCQKKCIKELLNILDIQHTQVQGEEADDVIASLAIRARLQGHKVVIYSQDHDFEQMITNHVNLRFESGKIKILKDIQWVIKEYGVHPSILAECMQLTGDMGDNVPGANKIGIKTAISLIKANGSLRKLLRDGQNAKMYNRKGELTTITKSLAKNIDDAREQILLNKELVVLNTTIPVDDEFKTVMNPNLNQFARMVEHYQIDNKNLTKWMYQFNYKSF